MFCVVINLAGAILHKLLHFKYADNCLSCELHWCTWESERKQENSMASVWNISFNLYISVLFLELITLPKNKTKQQIIKSINTYIKSLFCSLPAISRLFLLCAVLWQHKFWGETQSLKLNQRFCTAHWADPRKRNKLQIYIRNSAMFLLRQAAYTVSIENRFWVCMCGSDCIKNVSHSNFSC